MEHLAERRGPLTGIRVVEFAGIGPAPLCGAMLADMGADIVRVDRTVDAGLGLMLRDARADVRRRGRPSVALDLKGPEGAAAALRLVDRADAIIDPLRPGAMERLGLGPETCLARNPRLVYGRVTGWGQTGPLSHSAGHDINYLALSGVLHAIGSRDRPLPPLNVVGDMGGGAMFLLAGLLAAILEAKASGFGQVVDVSMVEGAAYLGLGFYGLSQTGQWSDLREDNVLDGGAPFWGCYETSDGKFVAVGAIEAKFFRNLLEVLGIDVGQMPEQTDRARWPELRRLMADAFKRRTRDEWCERLDHAEACFAPVLDFDEAPSHEHNLARRSFVDVDGIVQPGATPRFSRTPSGVRGAPPEVGRHSREVLTAWGFSDAEVSALSAAGVLHQA